MSENKKKAGGSGRIGGLAVLLLLGLMAAGFFVVLPKITAKYPWLAMYVQDLFRPDPVKKVKGPVHVMFLFTDHFEPDDVPTVEKWNAAYRQMASKYEDADGRMPQHSWFWYFADAKPEERPVMLNKLSEMSYDGFGEIEIHLHHYNSTLDEFRKMMKESLEMSWDAGALTTAEAQPRHTFAFIHGLWSLDNSRGKGACGINNELIELRQLGCYADFTNPSWGAMHPKMVNRLYYATDDPEKPKSYDTGQEMEVGKPGVGDLFLFTGQSVVRFEHGRLVYDHGEIQAADLPLESRVDSWIRKGVHVKGRPDWIFVKVFAHSNRVEDYEAILGEWGDRLNRHLTTHYNDGKKYVLHYVTAREAVNIAKAAEAGLSGNPDDYRNYLVRPYVNRYVYATAPYETISFSDDRAVLRFKVNPGATVRMKIKAHNVSVTGDIEITSTRTLENESEITFTVRGNGIVGLSHAGLNTTLLRSPPPAPAEVEAEKTP